MIIKTNLNAGRFTHSSNSYKDSVINRNHFGSNSPHGILTVVYLTGICTCVKFLYLIIIDMSKTTSLGHSSVVKVQIRYGNEFRNVHSVNTKTM